MLGIALVHAVLMTIFVIDLTGREKTFLVDLSKEQAVGLAETLAANGTSWVLAQDVIGMEEIINSQSGFPGLQYAMFLDTKGKVLGYTDISQVGKYIDDKISKTLLHAEPRTYALIDNANFIDIATPILANNQQIGWARVGISRAGITDNIQHVTRNGVIYTFVAILIGTIFAWFMARSLTTDIRKLVSCANRVQKGETDVVFVLDREDELGEMAEKFHALNETLLVQLDSLQREIEAKELAVTRRGQAEKSLLGEKEQLAVTLRSIGDGVITTDLDSNIVLLNKVSERLTGWSQQEAVGKPLLAVFNIVHEQTGRPCENPVAKVLATKSNVALENHTTLIARDGARYIIEDSGAPILDKTSSIIGVVLVFRDVTRERRTTEELLKAKKLESVGVLAGGIAHDFNNILAAILGNIELAEEYIDPNSEVSALLKEARKASIRAKDLTQQLLTFAKGGDPVKKTAAIESVIVDSANFVLHGSSVGCNYKLADDLWPVDCDSGQISQVIQNIIINARHAMPGGGKIIVSCENCEMLSEQQKVFPEKRYIKITITDEGTGIPEKFIDKIFDPYFTTKGRGDVKGSGLGLAICHSIIQRHNGTITVHSKAGAGTRFAIYLPASSNDIAEQEIGNDILLRPEHQATILIMDDEPMIRDMAKQMLENGGYDVVLAEHGEEAIEKYSAFQVQGKNIDLVIMDLTIPGGMGGKDAIREILEIHPGVKAVVASGYSNDPIMANCEQYGFVAAISKPYQKQELFKLIHSILS